MAPDLTRIREEQRMLWYAQKARSAELRALLAESERCELLMEGALQILDRLCTREKGDECDNATMADDRH